MADSYVILNDWGGMTSTLRTRASGKARVSIEVKSEPLIANVDPAYWVTPVAEAIAQAFRNAISAIPSLASEATEDARKVAVVAYRKGKHWALKRYAGGRIGPMAPRQSRKLLDDSGRLVKSIVARFAQETEIAGTAVINVAVNRLNEPLVRERVFAIMVQHIPFMRNIALLGQVPVVKAAMSGVLAGAVQKGGATSAEAMRVALEAARAAADLARQLGAEAKDED